jgi:hypothetical protein
MNKAEQFTVEYFIALESQVWEAFIAGDAEADRRVLAPNFIGVYSTGFSDRDEHCEPLRKGPLARRYEIKEPRILVLSESLVMLLYLAVWERVSASPESPPDRMYVSSLWQKVDSHWNNVFSQDTAAAG